MQAKRFITAAALGLGLSVTGAAQANQVFFSEVGDVDSGVAVGAPNITLTPGQSGSLYVWVTPGQDLLAVGLNAVSSLSGVIEFTGAEVFNPDIIGTNFGGSDVGDRWQSTGVAGGVSADAVLGFQGFRVNEGAGIRLTNDGTGDWPFPGTGALDAGLDVSSGAFLFARLDYTALEVGSTDLNLQVSSNGISPFEGSSADIDVYFGGDAESLNASSQRGMSSANPDATITVIPEPATLGLVALGGLMALARRRQK